MTVGRQYLWSNGLPLVSRGRLAFRTGSQPVRILVGVGSDGLGGSSGMPYSLSGTVLGLSGAILDGWRGEAGRREYFAKGP